MNGLLEIRHWTTFSNWKVPSKCGRDVSGKKTMDYYGCQIVELDGHITTLAGETRRLTKGLSEYVVKKTP